MSSRERGVERGFRVMKEKGIGDSRGLDLGGSSDDITEMILCEKK